MGQDSLPSAQRRSFLTRMNTGLASMAAMAGVAMAQEQAAASPRWEPERHDKDEWLDKNRAKHRVVFDTIVSEGLGNAIFFVNNFFHTNRTDYGVPGDDLAVVIVMRHNTAPFGLNDAMWAKYGEQLSARAEQQDPKTKQAAKVNIYNTTAYRALLTNRGVTIDAVAKLGAQFAVCQLSTRAVASEIAKATGGKTDEVFAEISANLITNGRLVPAGVVTVTRAQERGYSLVSI